jgi:hypothetical protein
MRKLPEVKHHLHVVSSCWFLNLQSLRRVQFAIRPSLRMIVAHVGALKR